MGWKLLHCSLIVLLGLSLPLAAAARPASRQDSGRQSAALLETPARSSQARAGGTISDALSALARNGRVLVAPEQLVPLVCAQNARALYEALSHEIAGARSGAEKAIFEPRLLVEYGRSGTHMQNEAVDAISQGEILDERAGRGSIGVEGLVPSGGEWSLKYRSVDRRGDVVWQARNSPVEYRTVLELSFRQPLLRGLGSDMTLARARIAEAEQEIAFQRYRGRLLEVAGEAARAYWDFYRADRLKNLQQDSLKVAERLLRTVEDKAAAGKLPRTQIAEAQAGVTTRRAALLQAEQEVADGENQIWNLLNMAPRSGSDHQALTVAQEPAHDSARPLDPQGSFERALSNWPDYLLFEKKLEQERIRVDYAEDQLQPDLSLVTSYALPGIENSYGAANRTAASNDYYSWFVGLELKMPLFGNERGRKELTAARLGRRQAEQEQESVRTTLANSIDSKVRMVTTLRRQLQEQRRATGLRRELLEAELDRFAMGGSEIRDVLDKEEDLNEAQRAELKAAIELEKAFVTLEQAEGILLEKYHVAVRKTVADARQ